MLTATPSSPRPLIAKTLLSNVRAFLLQALMVTVCVCVCAAGGELPAVSSDLERKNKSKKQSGEGNRKEGRITGRSLKEAVDGDPQVSNT